MCEYVSNIELINLKFILNETEFYERIRMERGTRRAKPIERILDNAKDIPKPKSLYCVSDAKIVNDSQFTLNGILFTSKIGVAKIADSKFVIPNIVTAGVEIEDYCFTRESVLEQYIVMEICNSACQFAKDAMIHDLKKNYGIALKECIFPGEDGFLLESGKKIFDVFGDVESKIGVSISEMGLPTPSRSAYSICFA